MSLGLTCRVLAPDVSSWYHWRHIPPYAFVCVCLCVSVCVCVCVCVTVNHTQRTRLNYFWPNIYTCLFIYSLPPSLTHSFPPSFICLLLISESTGAAAEPTLQHRGYLLFGEISCHCSCLCQSSEARGAQSGQLHSPLLQTRTQTCCLDLQLLHL